MHNKNIVHFDLKPANILYNPMTFEIKIIDFGMACFNSDKDNTKLKYNVQCDRLHGTLQYTYLFNIEQSDNINNIKICDMWALFCMLFEFIFKQKLFDFIINNNQPIAILDFKEIIKGHIQHMFIIKLYIECYNLKYDVKMFDFFTEIKEFNEILPILNKMYELTLSVMHA